MKSMFTFDIGDILAVGCVVLILLYISGIQVMGIIESLKNKIKGGK